MKRAKRAFELEEKIMLGIVVVSTLMVGAAFLLRLVPTPSQRADQQLAEMAEDYYLDYLYPHLMGNGKDLNKAFQKYTTSGVPTIYLRQLLHYNEENENYATMSAIFAEIGCNTNQTGVRFYPKEPFGPHDYDVKYYWGCSAKN